MVLLEQHRDGVILPVRAQPGARRNGVTGVHAGQLKVSVTQAPEKGKANEALTIVLAESLGLKRSQVTLVAGETAGQKRFLITSLSLDELKSRIESLLQ